VFIPKVKLWVDAQDMDGNWSLGRIKEILNEDTVLIAFDGWSDKYNQPCSFSSSNIAPLRFYTKGYTGQQKITLREYNLQPSLIKLIEQKMILLKKTKLNAFSAYEITLFFRGDLFVLTDDLLTRIYLVIYMINNRILRKNLNLYLTSLLLSLISSKHGLHLLLISLNM